MSTSQGTQVAPAAGKGQETDPLPESPEETQPRRDLDFRPGGPIPDFGTLEL